jgi:hypothetical protein
LKNSAKKQERLKNSAKKQEQTDRLIPLLEESEMNAGTIIKY